MLQISCEFPAVNSGISSQALYPLPDLFTPPSAGLCLFSFGPALHQLHKLCGMDTTAFADTRVKLTKKGLEKAKRHIPRRKHPGHNT